MVIQNIALYRKLKVPTKYTFFIGKFVYTCIKTFLGFHDFSIRTYLKLSWQKFLSCDVMSMRTKGKCKKLRVHLKKLLVSNIR